MSKEVRIVEARYHFQGPAVFLGVAGRRNYFFKAKPEEVKGILKEFISQGVPLDRYMLSKRTSRSNREVQVDLSELLGVNR